MSNREQIQAMKRSANDHCDTLAWPTVEVAAVVGPAYFLTPVAVVAWGLPVIAGVIILGLLTYAGYTALHESVHGAVCGGQQRHRWLNELVGHAAAIPLGIPMSAHAMSISASQPHEQTT